MFLPQFIFILLTPLWMALLHRLFCMLPFFRSKPQQLLVVLLAFLCATLENLLIFYFSRSHTESTLERLLYTSFHSLLLAHVYFHIFNMSETARRIRLLLDIRGGKNGQEESYSVGSLVTTRLNRLKETRQVSFRNGLYYRKKSPLCLAALLVHGIERVLFPHRDQKFS